ncbi:hypothetical protein [Amycolatopsis sp. YIM 10]|nr:hypothetical protein [Amycolatopsis sp. YIM 10]QFU92194.1 hypothetical protein YIM_35170 [Amycolatopsis sp. YIM 10]
MTTTESNRKDQSVEKPEDKHEGHNHEVGTQCSGGCPQSPPPAP